MLRLSSMRRSTSQRFDISANEACSVDERLGHNGSSMKAGGLNGRNLQSE